MATEIKLKVTADTQQFEQQMSKTAKETEKVLRNATGSTGGNSKLLSKSQVEDLKTQRKENQKVLEEYEKNYRNTLDNIERLKKQHQQAETKEEKKEIGKRIAQQKEYMKELQKMQEQYSTMGKQQFEINSTLGGAPNGGGIKDILTGAFQGFQTGGIGGALKGGLTAGGLTTSAMASNIVLGGILLGVNKLVGYVKESLKVAMEEQKIKDRSVLDVSVKNSYINDSEEYEQMITDTVNNEDLLSYGYGQQSLAKNMSVFQTEAGSYTDNPDEMLKSASEYLKMARLINEDPSRMMETGGRIARTGAGDSKDLENGMAYIMENLPNFRQDDILDSLDALIENTAPISDISDEAVKNIMGTQALLGKSGLSSEQTKKALEDLDATLKSGSEGNDAVRYAFMKANDIPFTMEGMWEADKKLSGGIAGLSEDELRNYLAEAKTLYGQGDVFQKNALREFTGWDEQAIDDLMGSEYFDDYTSGKLTLDELVKKEGLDESKYMGSDTAKEDEAEAKKENRLDGIANTTNEILTVLKDSFWTDEEKQKEEDQKESDKNNDGEIKGFGEKFSYAMDRLPDLPAIGGLFDMGSIGITGKITDGMQKFEDYIFEKGWGIDLFGLRDDDDEKKDKKEKNMNGAIHGNVHRFYANGGITSDATTFTVSEHDQPEAVVPIANSGALAPFGQAMLDAMESKAKKGGANQGVAGMRNTELEQRNIQARDSVLTKQQSLLWMEEDLIKRKEELAGIEGGGSGLISALNGYDSYTSSFDGSGLTPSDKNGQIDVNVNMELAESDKWKVKTTHTSTKVKSNDFDLACVYTQGVK